MYTFPLHQWKIISGSNRYSRSLFHPYKNVESHLKVPMVEMLRKTQRPMGAQYCQICELWLEGETEVDEASLAKLYSHFPLCRYHRRKSIQNHVSPT